MVNQGLVKLIPKGINFFGYRKIMERADLGRFKKDTDVKMLTKMLEFTADGLMREQFMNGSFQPEIYYKETRQYFDMMKTLCYK